MSRNEKPFYEEPYQKCNNKMFYPILKVLCQFGKRKVSLKALADTGCDSGIVFLKDEVKILKERFEGFELGEKINDLPIEISVANGHIVGADVYLLTIELGGEQIEIDLIIIDSDNIIRKEKGETEDVLPLIGRNFLNNFDVLFQGKEKKLVVFKCVPS